jgi:hypothetical protein
MAIVRLYLFVFFSPARFSQTVTWPLSLPSFPSELPGKASAHENFHKGKYFIYFDSAQMGEDISTTDVLIQHYLSISILWGGIGRSHTIQT